MGDEYACMEESENEWSSNCTNTKYYVDGRRLPLHRRISMQYTHTNSVLFTTLTVPALDTQRTKSGVSIHYKKTCVTKTNEWLSCNLGCQSHTVSYTSVIATSYCVIETEPHPFYIEKIQIVYKLWRCVNYLLTMGHVNVGSVGRLIPNDESPCSQCNFTALATKV